MCKIILFRNNSWPKPNYKSVYCSLKNMSLGETAARGDAKSQNFNRKVDISNKGKHLEKKK